MGGRHGATPGTSPSLSAGAKAVAGGEAALPGGVRAGDASFHLCPGQAGRRAKVQGSSISHHYFQLQGAPEILENLPFLELCPGLRLSPPLHSGDNSYPVGSH